MFDQNAPARDIEELARALFREHRPGHIYRGQTKYYDPTVPSAFRPFIKEVELNGWVKLRGIADLENAPNVDHEAERYEIKDLLARTFNRGLTNLLAQQYGLSSDMFDVTDSINVAGIFATRSWPTYQPYAPKQVGEMGVIYRMHCKATAPTLRQFEELTEHYYVPLDTGQKLFFENVHSLTRHAQSLIESLGISAILGHEFPEGMQLATLLKMPFYCQPSMMRRFLIQRLNECGFGTLVGSGKPFASIEHAYDCSRIARQKGGVVSPALRYEGAIPASLSASPRNGDPNWLIAKRDFAVSNGLNSVFNLNNDPNFERFFFLHDPSKAIAVDNLDDLWPARDADPIFDMMSGAVEGYFADIKGIQDFDSITVLDRGYAVATI
jgi:hypothetical protein